MEYKTRELDGARLNQAVAHALGYRYEVVIDRDVVGPHTQPTLYFSICMAVVNNRLRTFSPAYDWGDGGPIIANNRISLACVSSVDDGVRWEASTTGGLCVCSERDDNMEREGAAPLIAAMRAFVVSSVGETISLP